MQLAGMGFISMILSASWVNFLIEQYSLLWGSPSAFLYAVAINKQSYGSIPHDSIIVVLL